MPTLNVAILLILTCYYVYTPIISLSRDGFTFQSGIKVGILYFLLIPLWIAAVTGLLPVPIDFLGTLIPDLRWGPDAEFISYMMAPLVVLPIFLIFIRPLLVRQNRLEAASALNGRDGFYLWTYLSLYILVALVVYVISGLSAGGHWYRTREEFLINYGVTGAFLQYSIVATRVLFLSTIIVGWLRGSTNLKKVILFIVIVCAIDLYITGNRIFTLQCALVLAVAMIRKRRVKTLMLCFALAIPFGVFMGVFRWIRSYLHDYTGSGFAGAVAGLSKGFQFAADQVLTNGFGVVDFISSATESVNVNVYYAIVRSFSAGNDYLYGGSYLKLFVFAVPRSIWADKPDSITAAVGKILAPGTGVSLITTLFGECYANFGPLTFFVAPILIASAGFIVYGMLRREAVSGIICFVTAFTLIRMPYSDVIVTVVIIAVIVLAVRSVRRMLSLKFA
jgi:hypothetical protein